MSNFGAVARAAGSALCCSLTERPKTDRSASDVDIGQPLATEQTPNPAND